MMDFNGREFLLPAMLAYTGPRRGRYHNVIEVNGSQSLSYRGLCTLLTSWATSDTCRHRRKDSYNLQ